MRTVKAGGPAMTPFGHRVEWLGTRLYLPMSLIVLASGVAAALVGAFH